MQSSRASHPIVALVATAAALLLAACGGDGGSGEWEGAVQDSAGVTIVANPDEGIWTDDQRWSLTEELRVGVASGDPELQFGQVVGIDVDDEGRIFVLDQQAARIRVFDAGGELLHAFGGPGQGPGELSPASTGVFVDAEGNLFVPDMGNQRMARFTPEGEPLEGAAVDLEAGIPLLWAVSHDRTIVQQVRRMTIPGLPDSGAEPADLILTRTPEGEVADTLAILPPGESFGTAGGQMEIRLFAPETVWAVLPGDRLVTGLNSEYSLEIRGPAGETETVVRRDFERREVSQADRESLIDALASAWEDAGMPPEMTSQMAGMIQFEEEWPALAAVLGGADGSLWVQRVEHDGDLALGDMGALQDMQMGSSQWDVFDAEGRYLGVVEMPEGFNPLRILDDVIYGLHRDDLGIQRVVRMRIDRGAGA